MIALFEAEHVWLVHRFNLMTSLFQPAISYDPCIGSYRSPRGAQVWFWPIKAIPMIVVL